MIPFNKPFFSGNEEVYLKDAIKRGTYSGNGYYTAMCEQELQRITASSRVLMTSSCTHALEMCALLCDIKPGDEVIMASFNFVSAANAFVLRGARIVFVDIRPDTMNIDENLIEAAITNRTRAIVAMHYGGVACEMDTIMKIAGKHQLWVIEDAAHCIGSYYKNKHLGSIGHLGTLSFHATKNIHCGEGGALLINDEQLIERAEIIREKGTNRQQFKRNEVDKYTWVDIGSSYLMSELSAAFLYGQLQYVFQANEARFILWNFYKSCFLDLNHNFEISDPPSYCIHNGHIFFIKCLDVISRDNLIECLRKKETESAFHYLPLHSSFYGEINSIFCGVDKFTTKGSKRLLRLPMYFDLTSNDIRNIVIAIKSSSFAFH